MNWHLFCHKDAHFAQYFTGDLSLNDASRRYYPSGVLHLCQGFHFENSKQLLHAQTLKHTCLWNFKLSHPQYTHTHGRSQTHTFPQATVLGQWEEQDSLLAHITLVPFVYACVCVCVFGVHACGSSETFTECERRRELQVNVAILTCS